MAGSRTYRTKVLVLDKTKLKETDLILTMLDERGRQVRAVAKGARKPGGRLAARCEMFCTVDLLLAHGRSLDVVSQAELMEYDDEIVTSSVKNFNVDAFIETVAHFLPEGPRWFPEDMGTDASDETLVAEFVREKVLRRTRDEIPHSVGVICDALEQTKKVLRVHATIYVEREGQKGIIIGKGGEMIKHIGIDARRDLERIFGTQVFLELDVKVKAGWRDDEAQIRRFGYNAED